MKAVCPVCKLEVELPGDVMEGEIIEHECGVTLEVVKTNGRVSLKVLEGVEEDWGE